MSETIFLLLWAAIVILVAIVSGDKTYVVHLYARHGGRMKTIEVKAPSRRSAEIIAESNNPGFSAFAIKKEKP